MLDKVAFLSVVIGICPVTKRNIVVHGEQVALVERDDLTTYYRALCDRCGDYHRLEFAQVSAS